MSALCRLYAMGPIVSSQLAHRTRLIFRRGACVHIFSSLILGLLFLASIRSFAQLALPDAIDSQSRVSVTPPHIARARRFLGGRTFGGSGSAAQAMDAARRQH